ncbi:AraC family transcriptional regulator [Desulfovibrio sp. OttesenSCG-928-O18]|nr:AraC family transcriptional regulator [Desulfovibrio sp. OttesenSCG-928-O18]
MKLVPGTLWAYSAAMDGVAYFCDRENRLEVIVARGAARRYPRHVHTEHRVFGHILAGSVVLTVTDRTQTLREGERFEVPPGIVHSLEIMAESALVTVCADDTQTVCNADPCVAAVIARIMARPEEAFPLVAIARFTGYSQWHFIRLFRTATGLTPHAFQLACKIRLARRMLRNGSTAAEAAALSGFSDQSHMHKAFARHHGLTPLEFMRLSFHF